MGASEILADNGILQPDDVIELAAVVGLELAAAATLLQKESGGGRNIYGHDNVDTGGFYTKGGPVTEENFTLYRANRKRLGNQGVGPTQLTSPGFQDEADTLGGCWDWRCNTQTGFRILSSHITNFGVQDGFRRYNGSGPAAQRYAKDAVDKLQMWRGLLGGGVRTQAVGGQPILKVGDTGALVAKLQRFLNRTFPLYSHLDLGPKRYGPQTSKVIAEFQRRAGLAGDGVDPSGRSIGPPTWAALEHFGFR